MNGETIQEGDEVKYRGMWYRLVKKEGEEHYTVWGMWYDKKRKITIFLSIPLLEAEAIRHYERRWFNE